MIIFRFNLMLCFPNMKIWILEYRIIKWNEQLQYIKWTIMLTSNTSNSIIIMSIVVSSHNCFAVHWKKIIFQMLSVSYKRKFYWILFFYNNQKTCQYKKRHFNTLSSLLGRLLFLLYCGARLISTLVGM